MSANRSRITRGLLAVATAGVLMGPMAPPAQAAEVELRARMVDTARFSNAHGAASYEADHGRRKFEIHISGVRRLHGKRLTVRVHGDFVGRMRVGPRGHAHLERHRGVPLVRAGNVVRVRTPAGSLVTYGTFRRAHHR